MSADEAARIRQRDFYLEQSERFAKMAAEYGPETRTEPLLPVHGFTAVIVVHASDHDRLEREVRLIAGDWHHLYAEYGAAESRDWRGGRESIRFEHIYPEQTEESYVAELREWADARRAARAAAALS